MGKKCLTFILAIVLAALLNTSLKAQGANDVLRYGLQYPSFDPVTMVMPGVSNATGFGAYQENPAVAGLFDESFFSFGLSDRYVNEEGTYLGNTTSFDDNQVNVGDIGFIYNVPTARGKLTIGGGYSQSHDFNRAIAVSGRNDQTSITDSFVTALSDDVFNAAFDAFAIDNVDPENSSSEIKSIFRVDSPYQGIDQTAEYIERGMIGEYSAFLATEFLKNFIVGASIGVINGSYSYESDFLETDTQNDYETQFADEDGNPGEVGIDNILSERTIRENFSGFSLRLGAIYKITQNINIGGSYQFRNVLNIEREFDFFITNTLDDGFQFNEEALTGIEYKIVRPARINFGISVVDFSGLTFSAAVERVNYSEGRIRFEQLDLSDDENIENGVIESNFEDVFNLRFGLEYEINKKLVPRIGYGYYPDPLGSFEDDDLNGDRRFYSAGFTAQISENTKLNIGAQLGMWDDEIILYTSNFGDEFAQEEVKHWNVFGGLTFNF